MNNVADLVVFGTVYTAEDNKVCEAFAVKDGKYVYVGDREGAEGYIERGVTKVIDNIGDEEVTVLVSREALLEEEDYEEE